MTLTKVAALVAGLALGTSTAVRRKPLTATGWNASSGWST